MTIYQIRCILDNRVYIGKTNNIKKRWKGHLSLVKTGKGYWIHSAIRKYGLENFKLEILKEHATNKDEELLIKKTRGKNFNIHVGGKGGDTLTFHPDKKNIFEKRKIKHLQNVKRNTEHPKWVNVTEDSKEQIISEYFSYQVTPVIDICKKYNIKKDVFNRIIREKHKLHRSVIERFCYKKENVIKLINEYQYKSIEKIKEEKCGLSQKAIAKILRLNGFVIKKGKKLISNKQGIS